MRSNFSHSAAWEAESNSQRDWKVPSVPPGNAAFSVKYALVDKYQWWQSHDSLRSELETQLSDVFSGASPVVTHHSKKC